MAPVVLIVTGPALWAHDMRPDGRYRNRIGASPGMLTCCGRMICAPTEWYAVIAAVVSGHYGVNGHCGGGGCCEF